MASYGSLPFREQIDFFRRKTNVPTAAWTDIWQAEHDHAFVVAGVTRMDMLADFREAIDKAISQGTSLAEFRRDFDAIVAKYGWDYNGGRNWRSRVIYETNLRASYAAGRYAQLQSIKSVRPFWQYVHSDAVAHPRPMHLAWNGLVLDADDPWWQTHYPPNGWGCQCSVRALARRDLKKYGKSGPDEAPPVEMGLVTVGTRGPSPQIVETPAGVDPGFGYAPGRSAFEQLAQRALDKTAALPALEAADAAQEMLALSRVQQSVRDGFEAFVNGLDLARLANASYAVGALDREIVQALIDRGVEPATAEILVRDAELAHVLRESKQAARTVSGQPKAPALDELKQLPTMLADPQAVLFDRAHDALLYVYPSAPRDAAKVVVAVDYRLKTAQGNVTTNSVRTMSLADFSALQKDLDSGVLELLQGTLK